MRALFLLPVAALGLAACTNNPEPTPMAPMPAMSAPTTNFRSVPPDNPTGSQQYQSPDLNRSNPIPGQRR